MLNLFLEYLCLIIQSCPTVCDPVACGPQGFSIHGDSPGKNTGVGCHALLQGIFPTQGLNPGLTHCRWVLLECLLVPFTFSLALLSQPHISHASPQEDQELSWRAGAKEGFPMIISPAFTTSRTSPGSKDVIKGYFSKITVKCTKWK